MSKVQSQMRAVSLFGVIAIAASVPLSAAEEALPFSEVRGILVAKCLACHGNDAKELKGDYDLRSRAAAIKGGESGEAAIVPGDPDKSPLYRAATWEDDALQMPPKANDRLTAEQIAIVRRWIAAGAKWEDGAAVSGQESGVTKEAWTTGPGGIRIATSGGRSPDWDNRTYEPQAVWAYQLIRQPPIPTQARSASEGSAEQNPIDVVLLDALRTKGINGFAPEADRQTLIRRVAFDLTGLPPSAAEVGEFVRGGDYKQLIQRLLSTPHYGEQQARHWLDVVRYADTAGFSNDFERPNSWRYRDYVIRSFNADKPFDRFILEQVAGDELDEDDPELLIAAGYLRMGPWEHTGMTVAAITRQQYLDDVTNHIGVSLLGQGLRCAACHDHKFDPVPTRDYYRMQAVFSPVKFAERPAPFLPVENV